MKKFLVLSGVLALAACGSDSSGSFETEDGTEGSYSIDHDGGDSTVHVKTEDGEFNVTSGANAEVDLPDGFDLMPGATVITSTNVNHAEGTARSVLMSVPAGTDKVLAYYRPKAEAAGIKIRTEFKTEGSALIAGEAADGKTFSLNASANEDGGSTVQLSFVEETGGE